MELRWDRMGRQQRIIVVAAAFVILVGVWWLLRDGEEGLLSRDNRLELRRPGAWTEVVRTPKGIPSPYGEMSGLASSRRHPGVVWGVRDSGNPATIYQLTATADPGRFLVSEFPVSGVRNRDWEDLVYGEDAAGPYLLIIDTAAKSIYRVSEPDPARPGRVPVEKKYRYDFPDSGSRSCGPRDNVEAAFLFPAVSGPLHLVRKEKSPARVYEFARLSEERVNLPERVGTLGDSCISVSAFSLDNASMMTASHSVLRVRQGAPGDLSSFLRARPVLTARISPDNNEGGDFYPFGSDEILVGAENRTTWRLRHDPAKN